jgi:hypothetical protein
MTDRKPVFSPSASVLFSEANLSYDPPLIDMEKDDEEGGEMPARFASHGDDDEEDDDEEDDDEDEIEEELKKKANYNRYFLKQ